MTFEGMRQAERAELMARYWRHRRRKEGRDGEPAPELAERKRLDALMGGLRVEYQDRLPRVALSRCPLCQEPLCRSFDPYGLDGFWWHAVTPARFEEPMHCEHFVVLLGALDLHGRTASEVADDVVEPGPEVPFVVPRLLELPGMQTVIFSLQMTTGDTAYAIAYFAKEVPASAELHQAWTKRSYQRVDEDGTPQGWSAKVDAWDFDLEAWIEGRKLLWIAPGDDSLKLVRAGEGKCPYVGLTGERQPQQIRKGQRVLLPAPPGGVAEPFE